MNEMTAFGEQRNSSFTRRLSLTDSGADFRLADLARDAIGTVIDTEMSVRRLSNPAISSETNVPKKDKPTLLQEYCQAAFSKLKKNLWKVSRILTPNTEPPNILNYVAQIENRYLAHIEAITYSNHQRERKCFKKEEENLLSYLGKVQICATAVSVIIPSNRSELYSSEFNPPECEWVAVIDPSKFEEAKAKLQETFLHNNATNWMEMTVRPHLSTSHRQVQYHWLNKSSSL